MSELPSQMRAQVVLGPANPTPQVELQTVDLPSPGQDEVLIKVEFSPINPSDLYSIQGTYRPTPHVLGIEGSGVVVKSGGGDQADSLVGQRVAGIIDWGNHGFWSDYTVTNVKNVIRLADDVSFQLAASTFVNPMTVMGFMNIIEQGGHTVAVNTAASSQLGTMFILQCKKRGIKSINIVRRADHAERLLGLGADYVLVTSNENFQAEFNRLCEELQVKIAFDACGGDTLNQLIQALVPGGSIYVYGLLNGLTTNNFPSGLILRKGINVTSFYLPRYGLQSLDLLTRAILEEYPTNIKKEVKLEDLLTAAQEYSADMSGGKILVSPTLV